MGAVAEVEAVLLRLRLVAAAGAVAAAPTLPWSTTSQWCPVPCTQSPSGQGAQAVLPEPVPLLRLAELPALLEARAVTGRRLPLDH